MHRKPITFSTAADPSASDRCLSIYKVIHKSQSRLFSAISLSTDNQRNKEVRRRPNIVPSLMDFLYFISVLAYILVPSLKISMAVDSIAHSQFISDGMTLVSQGGTFELGFFSPGDSNKRYLGIWYKNIPIQTVVWVANRLNPINNSFGTLTVNSTGNLVLSQNDTVVWNSTNISHKQAQNPAAKLLDSGNLVVWDEKEANPEAYLWQSFDYPSDTLLPGMKDGWNLRKGLHWSLTAWKSPNDPAPGDFSSTPDHSSYPGLYLMKGEKKYSRFGPWNIYPQAQNNTVYHFDFVHDKDEVYYTYYLKNKSVLLRVVMNQTDYTRSRYVWVEDEQNWMIYGSLPVDYCDHYGLCGANGNCVITETPVCRCLTGFRPKSPQAWNSLDWSQGCVRNKPISCNDNHMDEFVKMVGVRVPDTTHTWLNETMDLEECRVKCLNNCSCTAYSNFDIRSGGNGCAMWFGDLIDIREFASEQDLYVRIDASEFEEIYGHRKKLATMVATSIAAFSGMLFVGCYCIYKVRRNRAEKSTNIEDNNEEPEVDLDLPLLNLSTVASATDNFSINNKIGQGGFGLVYRGRLRNGKEIAVKRLSSSSGQGMTEFKNEVKLIARLQHRNLVKLLGCCIQGQEQMLVYEYMPNSSLNSFIFDHTRGKLLDWSKRFHIIYGIARGLLYLHQDSRLRIIHRDLKASNVLLDDKLNPKISDFGMAKTFGGEQTEGSTNIVVGTYGYMAPEYIAKGLFSTKSDVFSFGILVLEIIHGKRNRWIDHSDHSQNLIGHAWILWTEGRALELIDKNIEDSMIISEVLRCIHISLLCAQQHSEDRPSMSSVLQMLGSELEIPEPKQPGFFSGNITLQANSASNQRQSGSINEISMTLLEAR